MSNEAPEGHQNQVRDVPKPSKIEAWDAPQSQNAVPKLPRAAKRQPRAPKKRSRDAQERPRGGQERPKDGQNVPRRRPDHSKIDPGTPQNVSWARFLQEPLFERLWDAIFDRFSYLMSKRKP